MMKIVKHIRKIIPLFFFLVSLGISTIYVQALEMPVGVNPVFPENQRKGNKGFFDLVIEQGVQQVIELEVSNLSHEESIVVLLRAASATTDGGGVVHFTPRIGKEERDETLAFAFEELVSFSPQIKLAPQETRNVKITIRMPDVSFDGLIAGGLEISQKRDSEPVEVEGMVQNLFNFELPVILRQNENAIEPALEILDVSASQWNLRNVIGVHFQNPEMMFINQMEIQAYVKDRMTNEVLYEHHKANMQVAPNSNFVFPISLDGDRFEEGEYILHMEISSRNGNWNLVETFHIEKDEAEYLNARAVVEEKESSLFDLEPTWAHLIVIGIWVFIIISIIYLLISRKKRGNQS